MIVGIDHVQLAMPAGGEEKAREFYGGFLGLPEVAKPPVLAKRGGVWFERGGVRVHLGVDPEFRPARKAHPGLLVEDLEGVLAGARSRGYQVDGDEAASGPPHAYVSDPFGNRLELVQASSAPWAARRAALAIVGCMTLSAVVLYVWTLHDLRRLQPGYPRRIVMSVATPPWPFKAAHAAFPVCVGLAAVGCGIAAQRSLRSAGAPSRRQTAVLVAYGAILLPFLAVFIWAHVWYARVSVLLPGGPPG